MSSLIQTGNAEVKKIVEELLDGKKFCHADGRADSIPAAKWQHKCGLESAVGVGLSENCWQGALWEDRTEYAKYTLALTNREVWFMLRNMVKDWFGKDDVPVYYNEFINALLHDNVRRMNTFMNKVALHTFSYFDTGNKPSEETHPERFTMVCARHDCESLRPVSSDLQPRERIWQI